LPSSLRNDGEKHQVISSAVIQQHVESSQCLGRKRCCATTRAMLVKMGSLQANLIDYLKLKRCDSAISFILSLGAPAFFAKTGHCFAAIKTSLMISFTFEMLKLLATS